MRNKEVKRWLIYYFIIATMLLHILSMSCIYNKNSWIRGLVKLLAREMHNSEFMFIMQVELLKHDKALLEGPAAWSCRSPGMTSYLSSEDSKT